VQDALQLNDHVPTVAVRVSSSAAQRHVGEVMTHLVVSVHADDDLDTAIDLLRSTMVKSLPVLQQGRVVGMISRSDVIHLLAGRDQRIRGDFADLLRRENLDWQVEVSDSIVKVTGPTNEQEHQQAEALSTTVRGVIAVHIP
jgi:CBS domain-containing protein